MEVLRPVSHYIDKFADIAKKQRKRLTHYDPNRATEIAAFSQFAHRQPDANDRNMPVRR
jgi:hypothetical protein